MNTRRSASGFTLVDLLVACTVAGVLAGVALPSYRGQLLKSRRSDAVAALTLLQAAQERMRASQGIYSADLAALQVSARSSEGLYTLAVDLTGPESYRASATAVAGSVQAADHDCPQLALEVRGGFAQLEPSARCWNR